MLVRKASFATTKVVAAGTPKKSMKIASSSSVFRSGNSPSGVSLGTKNLQHRTRGGELVHRLIAEPRAHAIDELLDLRVVDSAHEKRKRMAQHPDCETGQLPRAEMARIKKSTCCRGSSWPPRDARNREAPMMSLSCSRDLG